MSNPNDFPDRMKKELDRSMAEKLEEGENVQRKNAFESPKNTIEETLDGIKSDVEQIKDDVKSILRLLKEQS